MYGNSYKKILFRAAGVAVGLSFAGVTLMFFLLINGAVNIQNFDSEPVVSQIYAKWTSVSLVCILAAAGASCAFAAASNNKIFKITSAALNLAVVACCIAFASLIKNHAVILADFNAVSGYITDFYILAGFASVLTVFYTVYACLAFKKPKETQPEVGGGE